MTRFVKMPICWDQCDEYLDTEELGIIMEDDYAMVNIDRIDMYHRDEDKKTVIWFAGIDFYVLLPIEEFEKLLTKYT